MTLRTVALLVAAGWIVLAAAGAVVWATIAQRVKAGRPLLVIDDPTPDPMPLIVGDFGSMPPLPTDLFDAAPTLREELIPVPTAVEDVEDPTPPRYRDRTMVQVGLRLIHRGCRNARTDFATDWICPDCVAALKTTVAS